MAEYIEKKQLLNDTRIRKDDNGLVRTRKFLFRNYIKSLPTADVVEREKIDKAIEEINNAEREVDFMNEYSSAFNSGLFKALEILKKNIGEKTNESND